MNDLGRRIPVSAGLSSDQTLRPIAEMLSVFEDEVVFHVGPQGVQWASTSATDLLGVPLTELLGAPLTSFIHPEDLAAVESTSRQQVLAGATPGNVAIRVRVADGGYSTVQARVRPLHDSRGVVSGAIVGWHVPAVAASSAATAFAVLAEGTRVLLRSTSEQELLQQMCQAVCTTDDYVFSWYGQRVDDADRTVRLMAVGGDDRGYTQSLHVTWGDGATAHGPTGRALRSGKTQVAADLTSDPLFAPWRSAALERGIQCSIALPVMCDGQLHGALMVYSGKPRAFDDQAIELLEYLAADIGYGLSRLRGIQALAASEQRFRLLAENAMDLVFAVTVQGVITWVSPSVRTVLGFEPEDLLGKTADAVLVADDVSLVDPGLRLSQRGDSPTVRLRFRRADGSHLWTETTLRPLIDSDGSPTGRIVAVRNVDEQVRAEEELEREVSFDALTGLAKKQLAVSRIQEILDSRDDLGWALLCVGVRGLRAVNQAFTYEAGDEVLRAVAHRLVTAAGAGDRVARIAGDEFVVLLRDVVTATDAAAAAERLIAATRGPVALNDAAVEVSTYVGIAPTTPTADAEELLRDATTAMRAAGAIGPDRWTFLEESVAQRSRQELDVQSRLRDAIHGGQIVAWFMPIVALADSSVRGHEALVRWIDHDGTVLGPAAFLDVAERSHLILDIDRLILEQALRQLSAEDSTHVAVNISAATLQTGQVDDIVLAALDRTGASISRLHLEVTETALFRPTAEVVATMHALADAGIQWWVDDFGTGYSSISHLRDLPIAGVKLDRSFSADVANPRTRARQLARGLAGLAHGMGLQTIAEGVETSAQADILRAQGWGMAQGWLYGKPRPAQGR